MDRESMLLAAAKKMDREALTEIFELYAPALYKYAYRLCNHAALADQIVGDVFGEFIEQISAARITGLHLRIHLYEIANRLLVREMCYSNFSEPREVMTPWQTDRMEVGLGTHDQRFLDALERALVHNLTDTQRHVVILRFVEGFSLKETAMITGKKVGNVKVIQNRAIAALRRALDYQVAEADKITIFIRRLGQA